MIVVACHHSNDTIYGEVAMIPLADRGNDKLYGGNGNDNSGGEIDDILSGGSGTDLLAGGSGNDTYQYSKLDENISITDTVRYKSTNIYRPYHFRTTIY